MRVKPEEERITDINVRLFGILGKTMMTCASDVESFIYSEAEDTSKGADDIALAVAYRFFDNDKPEPRQYPYV